MAVYDQSPGAANTFQILHLVGMLLCKTFKELPGFAFPPSSDEYIGEAAHGLGVLRPQLRSQAIVFISRRRLLAKTRLCEQLVCQSAGLQTRYADSQSRSPEISFAGIRVLEICRAGLRLAQIRCFSQVADELEVLHEKVRVHLANQPRHKPGMWLQQLPECPVFILGRWAVEMPAKQKVKLL